MWPRRLKDNFAAIIVGGGVIGLLAPKLHALLPCGPASAHKVARLLAGSPSYTRLLGLAQIDVGVWLASRQYREE